MERAGAQSSLSVGSPSMGTGSRSASAQLPAALSRKSEQALELGTGKVY